MSALLTGVVILLMFGAIGIVLWTSGRDVLLGQLSGGELSAFVFYAVLVAGSVGALSEVAGDLMQQRTTIIIAHRLATVRRVNRIVVMEQGRVVASGKHDDLIVQGGLYARLAALQFRGGGDEVKYHRIRETA